MRTDLSLLNAVRAIIFHSSVNEVKHDVENFVTNTSIINQNIYPSIEFE